MVDAQWGTGADIASCVAGVGLGRKSGGGNMQNNLQKWCTKCLLNRFIIDGFSI